jgi:hypothetical protein
MSSVTATISAPYFLRQPPDGHRGVEPPEYATTIRSTGLLLLLTGGFDRPASAPSQVARGLPPARKTRAPGASRRRSRGPCPRRQSAPMARYRVAGHRYVGALRCYAASKRVTLVANGVRTSAPGPPDSRPGLEPVSRSANRGMRRGSADHKDGVVSRYRPDDIRQAGPIQHNRERLRWPGFVLRTRELARPARTCGGIVDRTSDCTLRVELCGPHRTQPISSIGG